MTIWGLALIALLAVGWISEAQGLAMCDGGFAETIAVEVEPLGERKPEK